MAEFLVIAGMPRSGTQLTRRLLGSHPLVAVPTKEFKVHDVVIGAADVPTFLGRLPLAEWGVDAGDLDAAPIGEVYPELLRRCADRVGKPVAGEKSPGNEHCYHEMLAWFGARRAVFVHLVRNPLDRLASLTRAPFRSHLHVDVDPARQGRLWCASVRRAVERSAERPDRYRMVRYEDLTTDPAAVAADLFAMIGVPHDPDALTLHAYDSPDNTSFPDPAPRDAAIRYPGTRAGILDREQLDATIEATGELAASIGYDLDATRRAAASVSV
jgi:hypothetical protein